MRIQIGDRRGLLALERLERELPGAVDRGAEKVALSLGRKVAENVEAFKQFPPGTRRLARSFLVPQQHGLGRFVLGLGAPNYAGIHEFGGTITPRSKPYLVFQYPPKSGEWHSVKQVTIREKRYARDAVDEIAPKAPEILQLEIARLLT